MVSAEERPPRRGGQVPLPLRRHPAAEPRAVVHRRPAALRAARQGPPVSAFGSQTGGRWGCLARTLRHPVQTRGHGQKCPGTRPGHSGTEAWKRPIFNLIFLFWAHGQAQGGGGACTGTPGTRSLSLRLTPLWGGGQVLGGPLAPAGRCSCAAPRAASGWSPPTRRCSRIPCACASRAFGGAVFGGIGGFLLLRNSDQTSCTASPSAVNSIAKWCCFQKIEILGGTGSLVMLDTTPPLPMGSSQ